MAKGVSYSEHIAFALVRMIRESGYDVADYHGGIFGEKCAITSSDTSFDILEYPATRKRNFLQRLFRVSAIPSETEWLGRLDIGEDDRWKLLVYGRENVDPMMSLANTIIERITDATCNRPDYEKPGLNIEVNLVMDLPKMHRYSV